MSDKNVMMDPDYWGDRHQMQPCTIAPDVQASAEQLANLAATRAFEKVSDEDMVPQAGNWHGKPAWFRKRDGVLEVHMGPDALALADDTLRSGDPVSMWRAVNPAVVPQQRLRAATSVRGVEVRALERAVLRAVTELHKEWEPHLLTLEGGPVLTPSKFLSLMQAAADYREATGE